MYTSILHNSLYILFRSIAHLKNKEELSIQFTWSNWNVMAILKTIQYMLFEIIEMENYLERKSQESFHTNEQKYFPC